MEFVGHTLMCDEFAYGLRTRRLVLSTFLVFGTVLKAFVLRPWHIYVRNFFWKKPRGWLLSGSEISSLLLLIFLVHFFLFSIYHEELYQETYLSHPRLAITV
jgi:hypothetical protein